MPLRQRLFWLLLVIVLLPAAMARAAELALDRDKVRFSGFATAGAVWGGSDILGFRRDIPQEGVFDEELSMGIDSLLGLQVDARINDQLGGAVQLVIKDRLDDSVENNVAWAFLRYRFDPEWTLRAGRIGLDVYLLSEYRNLGFSYLWVRPPVEFYAPVAFDSFDGMDLTWSIPMGEGQFRAKLFGGALHNDFFVNNPVELRLEPALGMALSWESDRWQLRMAAAHNQMDDSQYYFPGLEQVAEALNASVPLWPDAAMLEDRLVVKGAEVNYYSIGAAYSSAPWQIQAEVSYLDSAIDIFPTLLSSYVSVGRQVGPVTLYTLLSDANLQNDRLVVPAPPYYPSLPAESAQLSQLAAVTQGLFDGAYIDQSTFSLGARWDVRYDMALKCQWDRSWVDRYGSSLWDQQGLPAGDQTLDTFSINLNVIF